MIRAIDNGKFVTNLDANHLLIRNLGAITPPPPNLIGTDDPRLTDARSVPDGSVTDDSVADDAAISQFKLVFDPDGLPLTWLGSSSTQAAQADLVQLLTGRDQPGGYSSLTLDGKLPSGTTPTLGTGTLHTIDIQMPLGEVTMTQDITGTDTLMTGYWSAQGPETWFGNLSGGVAAPTFEDGRLFPVDLIPGFDASRIISGTFSMDQLPMATGVGPSHSAGLLPSPGSTDTDSTAQPDDYLGRDMEYHAMKPVVSTQPTLPPPSISLQSMKGNEGYINITSGLANTTLFYKTGADVFTEISKFPLILTSGTIISAYVAKIGYNNSNIATYTVPPPSTG